MLSLPHTTTVNSMYNLGHRSKNEEIWYHTVLLHLQFATRLVNTVLTPYDTICVWTIYSYIWVSHSGSPRPFYSYLFRHPNNLAKNTNSRANEFLYIYCDHQLFECISTTPPDALSAGEVLHHFQGQCYQLQHKSAGDKVVCFSMSHSFF